MHRFPFALRSVYDPAAMREVGFDHYGIGRSGSDRRDIGRPAV
jgi:hypothetical protein